MEVAGSSPVIRSKSKVPVIQVLFILQFFCAIKGLEGVALRPPPVADKGSKALSEIRSIRQCIYAQRNATIFQTANIKM